MILKDIHEKPFPNQNISYGKNVETVNGGYPKK